MPTGYTFRKPYLKKTKSTAARNAALVLTTIALVVVVFVVINRIPKKTDPPINTVVNTNTQPINSITKNTNNNSNINIADNNSNTATEEPITEVTNTATNTNITPAGNLSEINRGNATKKQVILTFDAGSGAQSAQQILDVLKKYHLSATFFMTGKWMEKNPDLVKQVSKAGHAIYNHTYSHPHLTQISDSDIISELEKTEEIFHNLTGKSTKPYFRAPYGERNAHVLEIAAQQGYQSVYWSTDALDWKESDGVTAQQVIDRIMSNLKLGAIYLMHVGDTLTGTVLDTVIAHIQSKGYDIVSLTKGIQ